MKRYCLALDLKDDAALISEYEAQHKAVWPEIIASIRQAGIQQMEIYRLHNRLFMIMETDENFTFEAKNKLDQQNPTVQQWEDLMWKYQQAIGDAGGGEKWKLMDRIFNLNDY